MFALAFRQMSILRISGFFKWSLSFAFSLKVAIGFYFLYVYTSVYGSGTLSADAGAFIEESAMLNSIFYDSPLNYFKLLLGSESEGALMYQYLGETSHWDSGAQAITSDNRNILRVHSLIHFISFGNSGIHMLIMCFISTLGLKQLFIALKDRTLINNKLLFLLLLLFPSLLFWTSGILKEPLMFLGFGLIARALLSNDTLKYKWIFGFLGALILLGIKPYILIAMIPSILFFLFYRLFLTRKIIKSIAVLSVLAILTPLIFQKTTEKVVHLFSRKQFDFINVGKGGIHVQAKDNFYFFNPKQIHELKIANDSVWITKKTDALILQHGSMEAPVPVTLHPNDEKWPIYFYNKQSYGFIALTPINNSPIQLLKNVPEALTNALFRPFLNDPGSWLKYPAVLETVFLFLFFIYTLLRKKKLSQDEIAITIGIGLFVLILLLTIGWVTPVLGAIVRYRVPAYIGILIISLVIVDSKKKKDHISH